MASFNRCGNTKSITYDDGKTTTAPVLAVEYEYDNNGNLGVLKDHLGNRTVKYLYDATDRLMKVEADHLTVGWEYDDLNNLTQQKYTVDESYFTYNLRGKADVVTSYTYDKDNRPTQITSQVTDKNNTYNAGLVSANYTYDGYGRNGSTEYWHGENKLLTRSVEFVTTDDFTTSVVSKLTNATDFYNVAYQYEYDAQGNITSITCGNKTITYEYDKLNQLVRENNPITGETWKYTYDLGGNITEKIKYAYTTAANPTGGAKISYSYDDPNWPDLLTKYNGKTITSDAIGNMLSDGTWTYTWQNGRQLAGMSKSGTSISYTYDSDGMRTSKTVNGTTTKYMYHGGQLVAMDTEFGPVYFHYDASGVVAMEVQNTLLYYVKNAQGDVVALVDTNGYPVVEYTYDVWGNVISTTGLYATTYGVYNPFGYRGYVYDSETGLYYLQSRYYSPEMGRFINADIFVSTGQGILGNNMFVYCGNNPVNRSDPSGVSWQSFLDGVKDVWNGFKDWVNDTFGFEVTAEADIDEKEVVDLAVIRITHTQAVEAGTGSEKPVTAYINTSTASAGIEATCGNMFGEVGLGLSDGLYTEYGVETDNFFISVGTNNGFVYSGGSISFYSDGYYHTVTIEANRLAVALVLVALYAPQYLPVILGGQVATT